MRALNKAGIELIKKFEGLRLETYLCAAGVPTIGYGHTGASVKLGQKITEHQAETILKSDLEKFSEGVDSLTKALKLTDNQFAALVALAFNIGITRFASSTLYKKLMKKDFKGAEAEFGKWVHGGGKKLPGLVKRRAAELALFQSP